MTTKAQVHEPVNVHCSCGAVRFPRFGTTPRIKDVDGNIYFIFGGTILASCRRCGREERLQPTEDFA